MKSESGAVIVSAEGGAEATLNEVIASLEAKRDAITEGLLDTD